MPSARSGAGERRGPLQSRHLRHEKAPAAPTMGQALNTPVDVEEPSKELKDAAKKSVAAAPTMGEACIHRSIRDHRRRNCHDRG
jgi:hypothetical protein